MHPNCAENDTDASQHFTDVSASHDNDTGYSAAAYHEDKNKHPNEMALPIVPAKKQE